MFSNTTNYVNWVDGVFLVILIISLVLIVLISAAIIYFVIKYNRKKNNNPKQIEGNTLLEVIWTVIPTILVLGMFYYGWAGYTELQSVPENSFEIEVIGKMWKWEFKYPNGILTDTLYVPVNKPIKLNLKTVDVSHAFWIPALRIKRDVIPNRNNWLWFKAEKLGDFEIACTQYCGLQHSYMYSKVYIFDEDKFNTWYVAMGDSLNKKM